VGHTVTLLTDTVTLLPAPGIALWHYMLWVSLACPGSQQGMHHAVSNCGAGKGRGLVATRTLAAGDLVLVREHCPHSEAAQSATRHTRL
jgi:hypothetical protein